MRRRLCTNSRLGCGRWPPTFGYTSLCVYVCVLFLNEMYEVKHIHTLTPHTRARSDSLCLPMYTYKCGLQQLKSTPKVGSIFIIHIKTTAAAAYIFPHYPHPLIYK